MLRFSSLNILHAGKSTLQDVSENDVFINAKDRGGLWKVIPQVFQIVGTHF